MLPLFRIIRLSLYSTIILWSIVVLALSVHFVELLIPSAYTGFIPFGIICGCVTLFILGTLLCLDYVNKSYIVSQVRTELGLVGLLAIMWLVMGAYMSSGDVARLEVECETDADFEDDWDPSETLLAQFRVVKAFSLFNTILLIIALLGLLGLSLRHHLAGRRQVWTAKTIIFPWFVMSSSGKATPEKQSGGPQAAPLTALPVPASSRRSRREPLTRSNVTGSPREAEEGKTHIIWIPPPPNLPQRSSRRRT